MAERQDDVRKHYGIPEMAAKIVAALQESGADPDRMPAEQLYPFDQLHGRNLAATEDHVARLQLTSSDRVLDIGCGIGGPARYIATRIGATVTGIDLTKEFIESARELTRRCDLQDKVTFEEGDALAMPFAADSFDAALCLYVAMNIEAKAKLAAEIARVLKPGGRLVWSQVVLGDAGEPRFPLPWARDASFSFLTKPETLRTAIESSGLRILDWIDERPTLLAWMDQQRQAAAGQPKSDTAAIHDLLMGEDFPERRKNFARNLVEGRIGSVAFLAEKPR